MLRKLATILREQLARRNFRTAFRGASGVIDLASIMVGIIVIGIIGGVIAATVIAIIPWSQDSAARSNLDAVRTAQSVAKMQHHKFLDYADLIAQPGSVLQPSPNVTVRTDIRGTCYISVAISDSGNQYFGTSEGLEVEQITGDTPAAFTDWCLQTHVTTLAGSTAGFADGTGSAARFHDPRGVAVDSSGTVYVVDNANHRIRKITPAGVVTTLAGSGVAGFADGTGSAAKFYWPEGVAVDSSGTVYVADNANQRIRKITPTGVVTTLAGSGVAGFADGTGTAARFNGPVSVAVDSSGTVYVADTGNHRIRKITPAGVVTTLAGSGVAGFADGTGGVAQFNQPRGVAVESSGTVYIADHYNNRVRKITSAGVVTTLAGSSTQGFVDGTGSAAQFSGPYGVIVNSSGTVYVADYYNNRIRRITPAGVVTTLAGSGVGGFADGTDSAAQFNSPIGVAVDSSGTVYVGDTSNQRIRKIQ